MMSYLLTEENIINPKALVYLSYICRKLFLFQKEFPAQKQSRKYHSPRILVYAAQSSVGNLTIQPSIHLSSMPYAEQLDNYNVVLYDA